ncbi:uncharacterized protein LOC133459639 [Cololabis saira]|uniref:uncharacterized protein LOC133459639 n=1 Tax=Cololabis saira TaxID=129043 RepID=UPI002AD35702|nr:uncharacterized protein LOC133459639 [Cololabis saira]
MALRCLVILAFLGLVACTLLMLRSPSDIQRTAARSKRSVTDVMKCSTSDPHTTILCAPRTKTTTFVIPFHTSPKSNDVWRLDMSGVMRMFGGKYPVMIWYMTLGDFYTWSWKYLVGESNADWSSSTTDRKALQWRKQLSLTSSRRNLVITLRPDQRSSSNAASCADFLISPWVEAKPPRYQYKICYTDSAPKVEITTWNGNVKSKHDKHVLINGKGETMSAPITNAWSDRDRDPAGRVNSWWTAVKSIVDALHVNSTCYACSLMPHSQRDLSFVKPKPLTVSDVICVLKGMFKATNTSGKPVRTKWLKLNLTDVSECSRWNQNLIGVNGTEA